MKRHRFAIAAAALTVASSGVALADFNNHEFNDGAIVVSDSWCAPYNDGYCNVCNPGRLINGTTCTGRYCDNMRFQCAGPPSVAGAATSLSGPRFIINQLDPGMHYGWTSDEDGWPSENALCPVGYAMVGAYSSNSYSDNIRTVCQLINRTGGWNGVTVTRQTGPVISEEAPNTSFSNTSTWLMGHSCQKYNDAMQPASYCDLLIPWFVTIN
jgi:hypothetical protein